MRKFNSHIKVKTCKCGCGGMPTIGWQGYKYSHAPQELKDKQTKKQVERRLRANKAQISRKLHQVANDKGMQIKSNFGAVMNSQEHWFDDRRKEMTGRCVCGCNKPSSKLDDKYWKYSIAHVLDKGRFKSVSTHPENWLELAFWGGCHTTFDNMGYEHCMKTKPILWEKVVAKFLKIYPSIDENEYKFIPDVLLQELNQI